jgi:hypothetical protein
VRRIGLAVLIALLTFSISGGSSLIISEPCTATERPAGDDGGCPPTCVTCGCCAQAVEPVLVCFGRSLEIPVAANNPAVPRLPGPDIRDILHVPRPHSI